LFTEGSFSCADEGDADAEIRVGGMVRKYYHNLQNSHPE